MFGIAMLVHAEHLTGSYAAAGIVAGAYAVAIGVGGPLLGRLVDRRGQAPVLVASAAAAAAALAALALVPAGVRCRCWPRWRPPPVWRRRRSARACGRWSRR